MIAIVVACWFVMVCVSLQVRNYHSYQTLGASGDGQTDTAKYTHSLFDLSPGLLEDEEKKEEDLNNTIVLKKQKKIKNVLD